MTGVRRAIVAAALGALAVSACGHARRSEPIAGPLVLDDAWARRGRQVYMRHCDHCHPGGEAGTGPSLNDKPAPGWLIATQVRRGLGAMPAFPPGAISDSDLDALVRYMKVLRRHGA